MKILFTSVGRRVELIQAFRNAANELGIDLEIIASDISADAPALQFVDRAVMSPRIKDSAYIPFLNDFALANDVTCIIPTIDTDLLCLSQHKEDFLKKGIRVLVSDEAMIQICRDKNLTSSFFTKCGLKAPMPMNNLEIFEEQYSTGLVDFPLFIKPKDGSSSINAFKVTSMLELQTYAKLIGDYVIQPFIQGREYTIDVFCDFDGNPIFITPRERIAVRAGEVLKTKICQDCRIIDEIQALIKLFNPCGPITVQMIRQEKNGEDYYIEINPRFGGGAPLSIKAGADSAKGLLSLLCGKKLNYAPYAAQDGLVFSRFDQSVCVSSV